MKNTCFWSTVALVAIIVLCLETVKGTQTHKTNEVGSSVIDGKFCGRKLTAKYKFLCHSQKRKRRFTLMGAKEASTFLHSQTSRGARSAPSGIDEECCKEGCKSEEILELC